MALKITLKEVISTTFYYTYSLKLTSSIKFISNLENDINLCRSNITGINVMHVKKPLSANGQSSRKSWMSSLVQLKATIGEFKSGLRKSSYLCRCSFTGINGCHETFILLVDCHQEATTNSHAVAGGEARVYIHQVYLTFFINSMPIAE